MSLSAASLAILALSASVQPAQTLSAHGDWAALRFGAQCEARSRALPSGRREAPGMAGFAFAPGGRGHGQLYFRLSRAPRAGATAMLTVGGRPFLLDARGGWAWSRDRRQDQAVMAAMRLAGGMRVEARDAAGRRFADRYSLAGAATAIDAAAAACAQTGKSR